MDKNIVSVDLEGVLAVHGEWKGVEHYGEVIPGAREFLTELRKKYYIVIFTCRCNPELNNKYTVPELKKLVEDWLKTNNMPYDDVYTEIGKPIAVAYVDDKGVNCMPQKYGQIEFLQTLVYLGCAESV